MTLLDKKAFKAATAPGGEVGPVRRHAAAGGHPRLLIPKATIRGWGPMTRADIAPIDVDPTATVVMGFLFGPIGALVSADIDRASAQKAGARPVIGFSYDHGGVENGVFLDFPLSRQYHDLHSFLYDVMPEKLRA